MVKWIEANTGKGVFGQASPQDSSEQQQDPSDEEEEKFYFSQDILCNKSSMF